MKQSIFACFLLILLICIAGNPVLGQKDTLHGHWKVVDMISDEYPAGLQAFTYEYGMKKLKARYDSTGEKMDAADSAEVKNLTQRAIAEATGNFYFQFNPDGSCAWSIQKGDVVRGSYKIKENIQSITFISDKNQTVLGITAKRKDKMIFFYYFKDDQLKLSLEDGTLRLSMKKE